MARKGSLTLKFLRQEVAHYRKAQQQWLDGEIDDQQLHQAARVHLYYDREGLGVANTIDRNAMKHEAWEQFRVEERLQAVLDYFVLRGIIKEFSRQCKLPKSSEELAEMRSIRFKKSHQGQVYYQRTAQLELT